MFVTLSVSMFVLALVAAVRSTWSPCGLSMLSSLTPVGERGRGQRFAWTAAGYVAGAVLGGAILGSALALVAGGVRMLGLPLSARIAAGALAAVLGSAADLGLLGVALPVVRRQVNERWLDRYRGWVYGAGFGVQIGVGFATYVMTAALVVVAALAALSAHPGLAFGAGLTFGAVRGLTVWSNMGVTDTAALLSAHRRYAAWRRPVWVATVAAQLVAAAALGIAVVAAGGADRVRRGGSTRPGGGSGPAGGPCRRAPALTDPVTRPVGARCPARSGPWFPAPAG